MTSRGDDSGPRAPVPEDPGCGGGRRGGSALGVAPVRPPRRQSTASAAAKPWRGSPSRGCPRNRPGGRRGYLQVLTVIPVGVESGWHTHPGEEVGYLLAGTIQMMIKDRETLLLHAGEGFLIPPDTPHNVARASHRSRS